MTQQEQELMDAAIQLAKIVEREACAKLAENFVKDHDIYIGPGGDCGQGCQGIAEEIADAIRARGSRNG